MICCGQRRGLGWKFDVIYFYSQSSRTRKNNHNVKITGTSEESQVINRPLLIPESVLFLSTIIKKYLFQQIVENVCQ